MEQCWLHSPVRIRHQNLTNETKNPPKHQSIIMSLTEPFLAEKECTYVLVTGANRLAANRLFVNGSSQLTPNIAALDSPYAADSLMNSLLCDCTPDPYTWSSLHATSQKAKRLSQDSTNIFYATQLQLPSGFPSKPSKSISSPSAPSKLFPNPSSTLSLSSM